MMTRNIVLVTALLAVLLYVTLLNSSAGDYTGSYAWDTAIPHSAQSGSSAVTDIKENFDFQGGIAEHTMASRDNSTSPAVFQPGWDKTENKDAFLKGPMLWDEASPTSSTLIAGMTFEKGDLFIDYDAAVIYGHNGDGTWVALNAITGAVGSINAQTGAITIVGSGSTTITNSGTTITVGSTAPISHTYREIESVGGGFNNVTSVVYGPNARHSTEAIQFAAGAVVDTKATVFIPKSWNEDNITIVGYGFIDGVTSTIPATQRVELEALSNVMKGSTVGGITETLNIESWYPITTATDPMDYTIDVPNMVDLTGKRYITSTASYEPSQSITPTKFWQASDFDGDESIHIPDSADWHLAGVNFSVDFWYRPDIDGSTGVDYFWYQETSGTEYSYMRYDWDSDKIEVGSYYSGSTQVEWEADYSFVADNWYHVAIARTGTANANLITMVNGVSLTRQSITSPSGTFGNWTGDLFIGSKASASAEGIMGYLDEFRWDINTSQYDGTAFTPETLPYYNINDSGSTVNMLIPFDGICNRVVWRYSTDANGVNLADEAVANFTFLRVGDDTYTGKFNLIQLGIISNLEQ